MSTHSVYALCDPRTGDIRYIGQAIDIYQRYCSHLLYASDNKAKWDWIQELKSLYLFPTLIVLEKGVAKNNIHKQEMYWIDYYLKKGSALTNVVIPRKHVAKSSRILAKDKRFKIMKSLDIFPKHGYITAEDAIKVLDWRTKNEPGAERFYEGTLNHPSYSEYAIFRASATNPIS